MSQDILPRPSTPIELSPGSFTAAPRLVVSESPRMDHIPAQSVSGSPRNETSLHPVDGGWRAWVFLGGAFLVETFAWGFPTSYGVFLSAYLKDPEWSSQPRADYLLPLIGTLTSGLMYVASFFLCPLANRFPQYRRAMMWVGAILCWVSLFGASYATDVLQLVGLQGVLYAIGGAMLYAPIPDFLQEWFVKRRGLGYGVINAGTSFAGVFFPLVLPALFSSFGTAQTLRYLSIAITGLIAFALLLIRPRLPERRVHGPRRNLEVKTWFKDSKWWLLILINTIQGFAYYVPIVWLPTYASALNVSTTISSLSVALLNGSSVLSRLCMGSLSDHVSPWILALIMCASSSLATFILWGVTGHAVAGLLVFGIVYGIVAGGWFVLWGAFVKVIAKDNPTSSMMLIGILMLSTGLGSILSTPISSALSSSDDRSQPSNARSGFGVEGGRFERMIVYVGTCFAGAALVALLGWSGERTGFPLRGGSPVTVV